MHSRLPDGIEDYVKSIVNGACVDAGEVLGSR